VSVHTPEAAMLLRNMACCPVTGMFGLTLSVAVTLVVGYQNLKRLALVRGLGF
jgi:hypothetical protein